MNPTGNLNTSLLSVVSKRNLGFVRISFVVRSKCSAGDSSRLPRQFELP